MIPRIAIGWIDRTTGGVQNFDTGAIDAGYSLSACGVQLTTSGIARSPECTPDSRQVYYSVGGGAVNVSSLWVVPLAGGTPRQVLPQDTTNRFRLSEDGRLAGGDTQAGVKSHWKTLDLATGRLVYNVPADVSDAGAVATFCRFSPHGRALLQSISRSGGRTILYQPLDGSMSHTLIDPLQEIISDFGW